ncbi:MAG: hypothetical protein WDN28_20190 [Chthoniobacter sp.]
MAVALVHEVEELADELSAGLLFVERHRLQDRAVELDEAVAAGDLAPPGEDIVPPRAVVGIKVAEAGQGLQGKLRVEG